MRSILLTITLASALQAAHSQDSTIYDVHKYKKGVYKTFKEFQQNAPSETGELIVKNNTNAKQIYLFSPHSDLMLVDAAGQQHKVKKFWGYSDGNAVYIHDNGLDKFDEVGYYCMYRINAIQPAVPNRATEGITFPNTPPAVIDKRVLDIVTGTVYDLTLYNMRKFLLAKDTALLREFNEDPQNKQRMPYYIEKFNRRNTPPGM